MEQFCINILGAKVKYISDIPLKHYYLSNKEYMEFYNANIIENDNYSDYIVEYHNSKNLDNPLIIEKNKMIINYPFEELSESIILYMGYHFLEKQLGILGICSCHSACIEKNGIATLLIGEAGAGKTSLAINLCINNGFNLISNDMTLVGSANNKLFAYGGTKFINLRLLSVEQNMPYLLYLFKDEQNDSWISKKTILAKDIGIEENYNIIPIKNILFIHVDNRNHINVSNGDTWRNNFLLYQNLSSHIRGNAATFIDKKGHPIDYIPSFDSKEIYDLRMNIINLINSSNNYFNITGNLDEIINFINNQNEQNNDIINLERKRK
ncbi:MAG: hypothetical protein E7172_05950 [Firmicutes bacterium]|nr:hypothetical protein [Bacillota bacterium]